MLCYSDIGALDFSAKMTIKFKLVKIHYCVQQNPYNWLSSFLKLVIVCGDITPPENILVSL